MFFYIILSADDRRTCLGSTVLNATPASAAMADDITGTDTDGINTRLQASPQL